MHPCLRAAQHETQHAEDRVHSLYRDGKSLRRQGLDAAGEIDVAVIEVERSALPKTTCYRAFTPKHLLSPLDHVEVGTSLLRRGISARLPRHPAPHARRTSRRHRIFVRPALPRQWLLSH